MLLIFLDVIVVNVEVVEVVDIGNIVVVLDDPVVEAVVYGVVNAVIDIDVVVYVDYFGIVCLLSFFNF